MCDSCGCGQPSPHHHHHDHPHDHDHHHDHDHDHRRVAVEQSLLRANDQSAQHLREHFEKAGILALNLVSSPGAGKTTLLVRTVEALMDRYAVGVIEGDQQTSRDAERIRATGLPAVQINTGAGCHLEANAVQHAVEDMGLGTNAILFIENVGNLVCPAMFDLGEACKVVILSVPEGDDKPLKYPHMFAAADLMIINKVDLSPYVDFDIDACVANARRVNPSIEAIQLSARTGEGLEAWLDWLARRAAQVEVVDGES